MFITENTCFQVNVNHVYKLRFWKTQREPGILVIRAQGLLSAVIPSQSLTTCWALCPESRHKQDMAVFFKGSLSVCQVLWCSHIQKHVWGQRKKWVNLLLCFMLICTPISSLWVHAHVSYLTWLLCQHDQKCDFIVLSLNTTGQKVPSIVTIQHVGRFEFSWNLISSLISWSSYPNTLQSHSLKPRTLAYL